MNIGGVEIGNGNPCRFVAEIGNAHNGSLDRCFRLIKAAKDSGCDFVKTQAYTPDELIALRGDGQAPEPWGSQGWTMKSLYQKAATPLSWFPEIAGYCAEVGIPWFSSVFGMESLAELEYVGCPAYKLASLDREARWLFDSVKAKDKPVIVSRPDHSDVRADATLFCPPGYPQPDEMLGNLQGFDGYSYHGTNPVVPALAATLGAKLVEFHFHLADEPSELESNISLDEWQTERMTYAIRQKVAA